MAEKKLKRHKIVPMIGGFVVFFALFFGVGNAIISDELIVTVLWSNQPVYQNSEVTGNIFLINNSTEEITILNVGLHFDWMQSDQFIGFSLQNNPVSILPGKTYTFNAIAINIPQDVMVGPHDYLIGINGLDGESTPFTWDSESYNIIVLSSEIRENYNQLMTQISSRISQTNSAGFKSSDAQSYFEQAEDKYNQATSLANQENWVDALSAIQNVSEYLDQADFEEQKYLEESSTQNQLLIIVGIVVVVFLVVLAIILLRRKKKAKV